jgi:pimeloyl-ACP methyl ester carboxylesterase
MPAFYWLLLAAALCSAVIFITFLLIRQLDRAERKLPSVTPERLGLSFNSITIDTPSGTLSGWYLPTNKENSPAIVMLHGWGGNAGTFLPFAPVFHEIGFNVLLPNASGHGDSESSGRVDMLSFTRDLEASLYWLKTNPKIDAGRTLLLGHSIAGAAALLVGSHRSDLAGVITFGVFANSRQIIKRWIQNRTRFPFTPFGGLALLFKQLQLGLSYNRIAPENTVRSQSAPVLMIHGQKDKIVPTEDAYRIAANGGNRITLFIDDYGGHATFLRSSIKLRKKLQKFSMTCLQQSKT